MKAAATASLFVSAALQHAESTVPSCKYPADKVGSEHPQVCYHIFEAAAPQGHNLAEKNCAKAGGDVSYAVERGIDPYYYKAGFIARVNYGVTEWTRYARCRHRHGSYNYNCHTLDIRAGCSNCTNMTTMEPEQNAFMSFPAAGEDMYWSQVSELSGNCAAVIIRARCLFSLLAEAGVCPEGCHDKDAEECNRCFSHLRHDEMIKVWHEAIEGGKCKHYKESEGERDRPHAMPAATGLVLQDATAELVSTTKTPPMDDRQRFTPKDSVQLKTAVRAWRESPLAAMRIYGDISSWDVSKITDMSNLFAGYTMEHFHIASLSLWDVSRVTTMEGMFADSIGSVDLSTWNIGQVVNMKAMFRNASGFDHSNFSNWDVSKVTNMEGMFENSAGNMELSKWDVSKVGQARGMFRHATGFRSLNVSKWNVRAITNMEEMFAFSYGVKNLTEWDVSHVTNMHGMFRGASQCSSKQHFPGCEDDDDDDDDSDSAQILHCPELDLSRWDVSKVTNMAGMFQDALTFNISGLHFWDVSKVTTMHSMFDGAESFNGNIDNWDVSKVADMTLMFARATRFNFSLQRWDVSNVKSMDFMFNNAQNFNGSIGHWDVSKVSRISRMFWGATKFNADISGWDVSRITDMSYMFMEARHFNSDLSKWDVSKVTTMESMFQGAWNFNANLAKWTVSKVTNMYSMFSQAEAFNSSLQNWDVSSVTELDDMFIGAVSFHSDLRGWKVSPTATSSRMFRDVACQQCAYVPQTAGHNVAHNCHYYCEENPKRLHAPKVHKQDDDDDDDDNDDSSNMVLMDRDGKNAMEVARTTEQIVV